MLRVLRLHTGKDSYSSVYALDRNTYMVIAQMGVAQTPRPNLKYIDTHPPVSFTPIGSYRPRRAVRKRYLGNLSYGISILVVVQIWIHI